MKKRREKRCPRCKSKRLNKRLNGENFCERCGQRWASHGLLIPSFDRRKLGNKSNVAEEKQLPLIIN